MQITIFNYKGQDLMAQVLFAAIMVWILLIFSSAGYAELLAIKKVNFEAAGFRDPFQLLLPEKKAQEDIQLIPLQVDMPVILPKLNIQGIVWGGPFPQVIIDGRVMRTGDVLSSYEEPITILDIKPKQVDVLFKNKVFTLHP
jgi:hypothetical protein